MTKFIKKPLSVLLAALMIVSLFAIVPISASAAAVTPKYKITINNKVVVSSTALPYTTSATNLKNKAGYSGYTVTYLKVYKAKDKIGTISGQNFTVNKSGSEQLDIGLKNGSKTGHITPNVVCTPLTSCVCEATAYTGYYDGEPHTIAGLTVTSPASGATVKYGTVSGTYNLTEPPTFTEVGTHTVYYQISASGWVTKTGSVNVNILSSYTVTWKNGETTLETDTNVAKDATPEYNGNTPEKAEDEINTYTFSGWTDGTTTYGKDDTLPAVTGDITYTATFTAEDKAVKNVIALINALPAAAEITAADKAKIESARAAYEALTDDQKALVTNLDKLTVAETALAAAEKLFAGHSVTLGGNIGVNFFINSKTADFANAESAVVKFTWDNGEYTAEVDLKDLTPDANGYYKASCDVVAAHMAHKIHAEVYLDNVKLDQIDDFSVQDYAEELFKNPTEYDTKGRPNELKALAQALLNYGAQAQTVFDGVLTEKPEPANTKVGENGFKDVTEEDMQNAINAANPNQTATDLSTVGADIGAKFYTHSLIYLSKNTLRIYFIPAQGMTMSHPEAFDGCHKNQYHYYVDKADIAAAELDNLQAFTVGDTTCYFSALDYAKAVAFHSGMPEAQKYLAKSLYLYNAAANAYFD